MLKPHRIVALLACVAALTACAHRNDAASVARFTALQPSDQPLKAAFDRDRDDVRVVMLVSPTCPFCLEGVSELEAALFETERSSRLVGFIVWVPMLQGKIEDVPSAAALAPDSRISQFWDGSNDLGLRFERLLPTPGSPAWDVYLLYAPGVLWNGAAPPKPAFWMHQLPITTAPHLDPAVFAYHARLLLGGTR